MLPDSKQILNAILSVLSLMQSVLFDIEVASSSQSWDYSLIFCQFDDLLLGLDIFDYIVF